ncbi:MAG: FecR domain-containing protein [Verrucomicrobiia bacterium]
MKYIQTLITMVVGGAVLALGSSVVAQTVKPCVVTVVRIQGQARYSLGDNSWHPLVVGKVLGAGAVIQSAVNSSVDIVLSGNAVAMPQASPSPETITFAPDPNVRGLVAFKPMVEQNVIRLWGNTVLAVDKLTQFDTGAQTISDTELDLRAGRIFFSVKKMSATSQFIIKIPDGVAGIRGSAGWGDSTGNWAMIQGSAVLSQIRNGIPHTVVINSGSEHDSATGNVTLIPQNIMDNLMSTLTSLSTFYQAPGGPILPIFDTTQSYCSSNHVVISF